MSKQHEQHWYCWPTAGHETHGQSAVYCEVTGRTIAIVYEGARDGAMLASAPGLLRQLKEVEQCLRLAAQEAAGRVAREKVQGWLHHAEQARFAIYNATR